MPPEEKESPRKKPQQDPSDESRPSPPWSSSTKRIVVVLLIVLTLLALYQIRTVLIPVTMSVVLAYVVFPLVRLVNQRTGLSRTASVGIVYTFIIAVLIAIPVTTLPPLITQGNNLINNTPDYLEELGELLEEPIEIGNVTIPLDISPFDEFSSSISENTVSILQTLGQQSLKIFSATLSTVAWILIVLLLSFYMVKDYKVLWGNIIALTPEEYNEDIRRFGQEASDIWNAFLRGQLILGLIIAIVTFLLATIMGLPNALLLGLLAGLLEFIPNIGPVLAAIPAVLLALFQPEASWLGSLVGPLWFALIVLFVYGIVQRLENMILLPRIIGRSLNLHPLVVLIGAIIGATAAGVFGILLAAPLLATGKLLLAYIYRKLLDDPPFEAAAE